MFTISSDIDKAYFVDVCIKLGGALANSLVLVGIGVVSCKLNKVCELFILQGEKENGRNTLYDLVSDWTGMRHWPTG